MFTFQNRNKNNKKLKWNSVWVYSYTHITYLPTHLTTRWRLMLQREWEREGTEDKIKTTKKVFINSQGRDIIIIIKQRPHLPLSTVIITIILRWLPLNGLHHLTCWWPWILNWNHRCPCFRLGQQTTNVVCFSTTFFPRIHIYRGVCMYVRACLCLCVCVYVYSVSITNIFPFCVRVY